MRVSNNSLLGFAGNSSHEINSSNSNTHLDGDPLPADPCARSEPIRFVSRHLFASLLNHAFSG
jgi:hypothetical protein